MMKVWEKIFGSFSLLLLKQIHVPFYLTKTKKKM
jgi:hypothetical protein